MTHKQEAHEAACNRFHPMGQRRRTLVSLAAPDILPNSYSTIRGVPATGGKPDPLT
jgi:hypothetical protein